MWRQTNSLWIHVSWMLRRLIATLGYSRFGMDTFTDSAQQFQAVVDYRMRISTSRRTREDLLAMCGAWQTP